MGLPSKERLEFAFGKFQTLLVCKGDWKESGWMDSGPGLDCRQEGMSQTWSCAGGAEEGLGL